MILKQTGPSFIFWVQDADGEIYILYPNQDYKQSAK